MKCGHKKENPLWLIITKMIFQQKNLTSFLQCWRDSAFLKFLLPKCKLTRAAEIKETKSKN